MDKKRGNGFARKADRQRQQFPAAEGHSGSEPLRLDSIRNAMKAVTKRGIAH